MTTEEKLKNLILSRYRSLAEFAERCGIKYQTMVSIFSRGVSNANVTNIIKICQTLGISTDDLADGKIIFTSENREELKTLARMSHNAKRRGRFILPRHLYYRAVGNALTLSAAFLNSLLPS